ncbi:MAG TPA: chemotaxis protein CheW [Methylovirgula sp.]|nr:chemotaxis protein CheW [Methylovirgula sp.]
MDELLNDFLVETAEHIESVGEQLVLFERDPSNTGAIGRIFRLFHTIKGTCGFLGLSRLEHLTHVTESLIGRLRDGAPATPETVSLILSAVDRVKFILAWLTNTGKEPDGDDSALIEALQTNISAQASPLAPPEAPPTPASSPPPSPAPQDAASKPPLRAHEPPEASIEIAAAPAAAGKTGSSNRPETIRVAVGALERIMILVSELVLTRNQLLEITRHQEDATVKVPLQRLSSLTSDLQDAVMRARMQPVGRLFASLPRLVRELSVDLKKKLCLVTEGADTELDRQLVELIRDPLTHLLRNCADHGIEPPEKRIAAGKPEEGTIKVSASHEAGYITIDVSDDGRGLDLERIRYKAVAKGLVSAAEAKNLSDDEVARFIFAPGFSTSSSVTSISGRGIGMDVVRDNIESIGGSVSLTTAAGKGTHFSLKIPLTLAIAPALIVETRGHHFALPQQSVIEAVRIDAQAGHSLESVQGSLVLRLRDQVLPVADLESVLGLESGRSSAEGELIIVMRVNSRTFGIIVENVADVQEIVVKPLGASLAHLDVFSGHTILGDGSVVLILDPTGIAGRIGFERSSDYSVGRAIETFVPVEESTRFVLFRAGPGVSKALPLSLVARIESVPASAISRSDGLLVMQHQDQLMPLVPLIPPDHPLKLQANPVLVLGIGGESMGLLIEEIIDVVEARLAIEIAGVSSSVIGTAEIRGEVVEILDATYFMRIGRPNAYSRGFANQFRVLLVDDKPFFRDMLAPLLIAAGYRVTTAASAEDALALFDKGVRFDALVTDTDMPNMSGYELALRLKNDARHADLPIVALAAHAAPTVLQAAAESGMCGAVGKFDRPALLEILGRILESHHLNKHDLESRVIGAAA